jgi:diadenosine tetraphosphatase ApaH/serine/threonine PP2A family protein phosphatase
MSEIENLDELINKIYNNELPSNQEFNKIYLKAKEILDQRKNIAILNTPLIICGCINAHFEELKDIFKICGDISENKYLFLGDYVGRGWNSLSTFMLLILYLIKYPNNITLLRGNHDSRTMSIMYGLYNECLKKIEKKDEAEDIYNKINELFDLLQLAAVVDNKYFCIHGGLSPELKKIDILNSIERKKEIPEKGIITDLIWSDPKEEVNEFEPSKKGAGQFYGEKAVNDFIKENNNIEMIIRSHELVDDGCKFQFNNKLLTVFSAPDYGGREGFNIGSVLKIDEKYKFSFIKISGHKI